MQFLYLKQWHKQKKDEDDRRKFVFYVYVIEHLLVQFEWHPNCEWKKSLKWKNVYNVQFRLQQKHIYFVHLGFVSDTASTTEQSREKHQSSTHALLCTTNWMPITFLAFQLLVVELQYQDGFFLNWISVRFESWQAIYVRPKLRTSWNRDN